MPTPSDYEDITPEDSVVPVYLVPEIPGMIEQPEFATPDEMIAVQQGLKDSALSKLQKFGMTEEEAKAVIGF